MNLEKQIHLGFNEIIIMYLENFECACNEACKQVRSAYNVNITTYSLPFDLLKPLIFLNTNFPPKIHPIRIYVSKH